MPPHFDWNTAVEQADGSFIDANGRAYVDDKEFARWQTEKEQMHEHSHTNGNGNGTQRGGDAGTGDLGRLGRLGRKPAQRKWPTLREEAYYGLPGELVRLIEPHSEADPVALLISILAAFGNVVGRGPGFMAEGDFHGTNIFTVLVGETSKGRKGTTHGRVKQLFSLVAPNWASDCIGNGLSSGEGLIWQVRDPIYRYKKGAEELDDPGVEDKRLYLAEGEFAQALRVMRREGNTLSVVCRNLWDSGTQKTLTKNSPASCTNAHVTIVGHISKTELVRELKETDSANGFANRFLFMCVRRSKVLPEGGNLLDADLASAAKLVSGIVAHARHCGVLQRTEEAKAEWAVMYADLSEGKPGLLGAITARGEAQVMRLATIYALFDGKDKIDVPHLRAAKAIWDYSEASAAYIFGNATGYSDADTLLEKLQESPEGMKRTEIRDLFGRNKNIEPIVSFLKEHGLAYCVEEAPEGRGRPSERWHAATTTETT